MVAHWKKHTLLFKRPSGTSRGVLKRKLSWFIILKDNEETYYGECGLLRGLSIDDVPEYEQKLAEVCQEIYRYEYWINEGLLDFPSIRFGLEMVMKAYLQKNQFDLFPSPFTQKEEGIKINGLVWMGEKSFMFEQIKEKIAKGFDCIKLKIGAIDFEAEINLLKYIRSQFSATEIEIRVDANGAFSPSTALDKLKILSDFRLHSIEQPIRQGQYEAMAGLCASTPLPIALDEELIGVNLLAKKEELLDIINPQYIILKPSLVGGFKSSEEWISLAESKKIDWWSTSALESNIGLNAISQWTYTMNSSMHQGLGTGQLYTNNIPSPLEVEGGCIYYRNAGKWDLGLLQ
ncbi:MAG: O-succinylbenzoate synthase [Maribacter sp.]|jgi:O-succinylbenzoate synthase